jgi:hypothetical protein
MDGRACRPAQNCSPRFAGALVTLSNGDIHRRHFQSRLVASLDVAPPAPPQARLRVGAEAAAAGCVAMRGRGHCGWAADPGLQSFDQNSWTVRLQVRTAPSWQDDVARNCAAASN